MEEVKVITQACDIEQKKADWRRNSRPLNGNPKMRRELMCRPTAVGLQWF